MYRAWINFCTAHHIVAIWLLALCYTEQKPNYHYTWKHIKSNKSLIILHYTWIQMLTFI